MTVPVSDRSSFVYSSTVSGGSPAKSVLRERIGPHHGISDARRFVVMKAALILLILCACPVALAQTGAADRVVPVTNSAPDQDSFIVKRLRPFAPDENGPLTKKQRFNQYLDDTVGPFVIFREAAAAGISQGLGKPPEWGGGMTGYGRRFADDLGFNIVHESIAYSAGALLHEDNRYFASGKTSIGGRTIHALLSPFEAHRRDGSVGFSYSNVAGVLGATALSRLWEPPSDHGPGNIGRAIAYSFGGSAAYNVFREFVPDLIRRIQKR